jgi:hypothetical protein
MFRTLISVIGRAMALWRAERLLRDQEIRQYTEFLGAQSSVGFNDRGNVLIRITTERGHPVEVEIDAMVFQPAYTVYALTDSGYRHIVWCGWSAEGAAAATAAAVDMAVYHYLFAESAVV